MPPTIGFPLRAVAISIAVAAMTPFAHAASPGDACALLTPAQVGASLGIAVGAGSYVTPTFRKTCTWNATTAGGGYVTLMLENVSGFEGGKQVGQLSTGTKTFVTSLSGVGDDAYYLGVGSNVGLIVKKGSAAFKVAVYGPQPIERKEALERTLAQQAILKL